jgi:guanylate kinase
MQRVILVGRAAAGKDFARKHLQAAGLDFQVSYTTRPARPKEVEGQDYFFISPEKFDRLTDQKAWHEHVTFTNGWKYGTLKSQFEGFNRLFIMSPVGLEHLTEEERSESLVVYFNIQDSNEIKKRLQERGWTEEQTRVRMRDDEAQFGPFVLSPPGIEITDPFFDVTQLCSDIAKHGFAMSALSLLKKNLDLP